MPRFGALLALLLQTIHTLNNGLGLTPPMGWNSWNHFHCNINEQLILRTADQLVNLGLDKKGYVYVNLDDCWQIDRDPKTKQIIADPRFPNGIEYLAKAIHSKGLKIGLYSDSGYQTCEGRPGSLGFERIDAATYARWKIDYLKYDNCKNGSISPKLRYPPMTKALNQTGHPIYFSMCEWGVQDPATWAPQYANSWRTTDDIFDNYRSFTILLDLQYGLQKYAKPGAWNDPDMLEVGNGGMTVDQYQSHFMLWCLLKSPLLIGCDLEAIKKEYLDILANEEVIAVNQDPLGKQGWRYKREEGRYGWKDYYVGELTAGRKVVVVFNRQNIVGDFIVSLKEVNLTAKAYKIRDIINKQDIGIIRKDLVVMAAVRTHAVKSYLFTPLQQPQQNK